MPRSFLNSGTLIVILNPPFNNIHSVHYMFMVKKSFYSSDSACNQTYEVHINNLHIIDKKQCTVIRYVLVSDKFGTLKLKCAHSPLILRILSSASVTLTTVQMPNLSLTHMKRNTSVVETFRMRSSLVRIRSSLARMRSSPVVRAPLLSMHQLQRSWV